MKTAPKKKPARKAIAARKATPVRKAKKTLPWVKLVSSTVASLAGRVVFLESKVLIVEDNLKRVFSFMGMADEHIKKAAASIENFEHNITPKVISMSEIYEAERRRLRLAFEHFHADLQ